MTKFFLFDSHNNEQHADSIAAYLPNDETFLAKIKQGSNVRNFLLTLAQQFKEVEELLNLFSNELSPDEANFLINEWESMLGIPDDCFTGSGTLEDRQRDCLVKLASLGIQTAQDFIDLADIFGIDVSISNGTDGGFFFPAAFPMAFTTPTPSTKFIIIVKFLTPSPLTGLVECLFSKLIPANCILVVLP